MPRRQAARPSSLRSQGKPVWFSTIGDTRELPRHVGSLDEVPVRDAKIPGQPVLLQEREALQPFVVLHGARCTGRRGIGAKGRHRLRPDPTHQRKLRLGGKNLFRIVSVEPGVRDDGAGKAVTRIHVGQPLRFGDLPGAIHLGFAMHRRQHVVGARIPQIVFRQVVPPDRVVRPQEEVRFRLVGKERVTVCLQVPKMMVRIDKRDGSRRCIPLVTDRLHAR